MAGHINRGGYPAGAQVSVYPKATPPTETGGAGTLATLYTDKTEATSINQSTNPIYADGNGFVDFYAAPGDYYVTYANSPQFLNPSELVTVEEHPNFTNVVQALAPSVAGALAIDASQGSIVSVAPTANMTPTTVTNLQKGQRFVLEFTSDGTHTMAYPSTPTPKWTGGSAPTPSSTSGYVDQIEFLYDGTYLRELSRSLAQH